MRRSYRYAFWLTLLQNIGGPGTRAQHIDLFAEIDMDALPHLCPGKVFGDSSTAAGPKGTWSLGTYGPATVYENTTIWYVSSMSRFLTAPERDSLGAAPGTFWMQKLWISENITAPAYLKRESDRAVDDIGILLDWELYQEGMISYIPPPYEPGKAYGFFIQVTGMGKSPAAIENTDNNMNNNRAVKKIIWGCDAVSVAELPPAKRQDMLRLYPNPASEQVHVFLPFKSADVQITVRTITGSIVYQRSERATTAGAELSIDVKGEAFRNGLYLLELSGGDHYARGKFMVQR